MTLDNLFSVVNEMCFMTVYDKYGYHAFAEYNGKDSIPLCFNSCKVASIEPEMVGSLVWFNVYLDMPFEYVCRYVETFGDDDAKSSVKNLVY